MSILDHLAEQDRQAQARLRKLKLEQEATGEELGRIRWEATMNPDNPDRVGFAKWGRLVGVGESTIRNYATAYKQMKSVPEGPSRADFGRFLYEQKNSTEEVAAASLVADAIGVKPQTASVDERDAVRQIKAETREVVAAKKAQGIETTFEEELPVVAAPIVEQVKVDRFIDSVERATPSPGPKVDGEEMLLLEHALVAALDALASAKHRLGQFDFKRTEMGRVHSRIDRIIEAAAELHRVIDPTRADLDDELAALVQDSDG